MTLEDFFTLTEMKDGLTSLGRIEELVSTMKKENDYSAKNIDEAARQWSTVASTLAATENQDSLDHFVRLDGLYFLDQWLQEAEKCSNDVADSSIDESVSLLLGALKKLPINNEKSVSSGIGVTVKKLFGHRSFSIQERARDLFGSWNQIGGNDTDKGNNSKDGECHGDGVKRADITVTVNSGYQEQSSLDPVKEYANDDRSIVKPSGIEVEHSRGSDSSQTESAKDVNISVSNTKDNFHTTPSKVNKEDGFREDAQDSNPFQENHSIIDESLACTAERINSVGVCSSPAPAKEKSSDVPNLKDFTNGVKETHIRKDIAGETGVELCSGSTSSGPEPVSFADPSNVQKPGTHPAALRHVDTQESESCLKKTSPASIEGTDTMETDIKGGSETGKLLRCTSEAGGCFSENSCMDGCVLRKPEDLDTSLSRKEDTEAVENMEDLSDDSVLKVEGGQDYATTSTNTKSVVETKISEIDKGSDMDLEYGVDDALEVARQVAKEIEREVVDYREQFCSSSSEKNLEGGLTQPSSPNSVNTEQDQPVVGPLNELDIRQNLTDGAFFPIKENYLVSSENKPEDCMHGTGSSQVTEVLQKPAETTKMGLCDFDLNEVCSEETDLPRMPLSVPITMVSASKKAARNSPPSPPRFLGELGWKGSAATSAFRPASGLRTSDGERTLSVEGSSQSSRQRRFQIDLNVAEGYGDAVDGSANPALATQIPVSSGLPSGESSIEVSSRRAERLKFDLNRAIDSDDGPSSEARMDGQTIYHHQNSSTSPASSSSSRHPPPLRNFDLNGPFFDDFPGVGRSTSVDVNGYGGFKADEPVISLMGSRVQVKGKEPVPQTLPFLQNGRAVEPTNGPLFTRSEGGLRTQPPTPYMPPPSSAYGYNLLAMGSSMPLSSAIYGPSSVPAMVDSRGTSMVTHMIGAQADVLPSYHQPPFMSMTGPLMSLNGGAGSARPSLDLNSGFTMETESRGPGSSRHAFILGQGMLMEEQMRAASQPQSSKRKEPDGGWDLYPANSRRQPPWH